MIVLSHPVLAGAEHRSQARDLLDALGSSGAVVLSSARAVAACAEGPDSGPLLVVDMGAELTEVTLLVDGRIADARQAETGLSDLGGLSGLSGELSDLDGGEAGAMPAQLVGNVLDMIMSMWRQDRHGAVRGALRRGPVLTGGGALHTDVTHRIAARLGTPVRLAGDPSTSVVRGAGLILDSVLRHTGAGTVAVLPGRPRSSPLPGAPRGNAPPRGRPAAPAQRVRHALAALLLAVLTLVGGTPAAVGAVPTVRGLTAQALSTTQAPSAAPSPFGTWPSSAGQVPAPHGPVLVPARDLRSGQVGEAQAAGTAAASLPSTPRTAEADLRISPASPACAGLSAAPPPGPRETRGSPCPPRPHLSASPVPTS
ncbi:MreB/Mbl protein, partial [Streptomyces sp. DpondAA-F4]